MLCFFLFLKSDSCDVDCVREKMRQRLQSAMRTLRKSINRQQFYVQFSGTEYEVAQKPARVPENAESCSTGQVLQGGKCGTFCQVVGRHPEVGRQRNEYDDYAHLERLSDPFIIIDNSTNI